MDVREMHITVEQGIQAIAANARREMFPEEIDWILNNQVLQYIGTHSGALRDNPGAADSLVHLSRLSSLIEYSDLKSVVKKKTTAAVIPYNVAELLSVQSGVQNMCGATAQTDRKRSTLLLIPVKRTAATVNWYKEVIININTQEVFNMQKHALARGVTFNGFQAQDELWRMLNVILPELSSKYEIHWETYDNLYYPSTIIIAGQPEAATEIIIDGVSKAGRVEYIMQTVYVTTTENFMPARLYFQTNMHQMRVGAFSRTDYRSPLAYLENDAIITEVTDSFIVGTTRINYVRKPRRIDLSLSQNCELPESVHPDICNLAIEHIKLLREDPNWEAKLKENMLRTTI
jgi:hypothetical protein